VLLVPGQWGVIVLTNLTNSSFAEGMSFALLDRHLGNPGDDTLAKFGGPVSSVPIVEALRTSTPPAVAAADFTGTYRHPAWGDFTIDPAGAFLRIRLGQLVAALDFVSGETFTFQSAPGWERLKITFQRNNAAKVTGFLMDDGSNPATQIFAKIEPNVNRRGQ
jgi:hypothetical protein